MGIYNSVSMFVSDCQILYILIIRRFEGSWCEVYDYVYLVD